MVHDYIDGGYFTIAQFVIHNNMWCAYFRENARTFYFCIDGQIRTFRGKDMGSGEAFGVIAFFDTAEELKRNVRLYGHQIIE
jgi:hypothetical protein